MGTVFDESSQQYAQLRPEYPRLAVQWLVGCEPREVVDVGAGTGKLSQVLRQLGHTVVAVEPSGPMRAQLMRTVPGVPAFDGTGESTELPDASADAVVYGQAWHWVNPMIAGAEAARVVRPGGVLGLMWNYLNLDEPWAYDLSEAMQCTTPGRREEDHLRSANDVPAPWQGRHDGTWRWTLPMRRDHIAAVVTTRSYYLSASEADQARMRRRVHECLEQWHPELPDDATLGVPMCTTAVRFTLAG